MDDELLAYYDEIRRLAEAKSDSREEAEDLLSETFLAAFAYRHNGGVIEHPKTYLVHTLMHKRNSLLRRKYRLPKVVSLQTLPEDAADDFTAAEEAYERTEEAAALRRTLLYLSETTREVLLRYYFNGNSVADIAEQLGIPAGTVKSRLSAGREAVRKGLTNRMNETKNRIPDRLHLYAGGAMGPRDEPMSLVEGDLIAQNLLIAAYDKPLTITELAAALSVPTVYLEPIVRRLTDGELMRRTDSRPVRHRLCPSPAGGLPRALRRAACVRARTLRMLLGRSGGSARGNQRGGVLPRAPASAQTQAGALRPPADAAKLSASLFGRTGRVSQAAGRRELDCDGTCVPRRLHRDRRRQKSERVCRAWRTPNVGRRLRLRRRVVSQALRV